MATGRVPTTANSPLTTKGDLFTYSTAPARLAVGANDTALVADSTQSTGLAYKTKGVFNGLTTTGDTIYSSSGTTQARLGIGSTGQVLTVAAGVPSWATPATTGFVGVGLNNYYSTISVTPTPLVVPFAGTESWDTDNFHSTSSNTSRITIPSGKAGKYLVNTYGWPETFNSYFIIQLWLNGSAITAGSIGAPSGLSMNGGVIFRTDSTPYGQGGSYVLNLAVGDYIELAIQQGGTASYRFVTDFQATYLGA